MPWKNGNPILYTVWRDMLYRCYDKSFAQHADYGGRGITVCPQWRTNFKQFQTDMLPSYQKGLLLDRINNDLGYSPENCRWATRKQQQRNQRVTRKVILDGREYIAADLADIAGVKTDTIMKRVQQGLPYEEVVSAERKHNLSGFSLGAAVSAANRNARTHCKAGHEYAPENTEWTDNGKYRWRSCKTCRKIARDRRIAERGHP